MVGTGQVSVGVKLKTSDEKIKYSEILRGQAHSSLEIPLLFGILDRNFEKFSENQALKRLEHTMSF